jgi:hypothetical protein
VSEQLERELRQLREQVGGLTAEIQRQQAPPRPRYGFETGREVPFAGPGGRPYDPERERRDAEARLDADRRRREERARQLERGEG